MSKCLSSINQQKSVGKDMEKRKLLCLLVGMQTGAASVESSMQLTQKIKNGTVL